VLLQALGRGVRSVVSVFSVHRHRNLIYPGLFPCLHVPIHEVIISFQIAISESYPFCREGHDFTSGPSLVLCIRVRSVATLALD